MLAKFGCNKFDHPGEEVALEVETVAPGELPTNPQKRRPADYAEHGSSLVAAVDAAIELGEKLPHGRNDRAVGNLVQRLDPALA